jgi:soluble lytic murein transglycosylase-like protein
VLIIGSAATDAHAHSGCHSRECVERVARKQCSQTRPVPCLRRAAIRWRVSFRLQLAIARCESGLIPTRTNDRGSGSSGLMQFMPSTWATTPYRFRWIFSARWNALAGAWLMRRAGTAPWTASSACWG